MLLAPQTFARLGETEKINSMLYGKPIKTENIAGYDKAISYATPIYNIKILYKKENAVVIAIRLKNGGLISTQRMEHLLHNNGARVAGGKTVWYISGIAADGNSIIFVNRHKSSIAEYDIQNSILTIKAQ
jgi:hypothetical protein